MTLGETVQLAEGELPRIGYPNYERNAAQFMVARMYTDAIFNSDIRSIQLIINRIDGGLPKDTEVDGFQTFFGDCLQEVLSMERASQTKVFPSDTLMMALCKSLYDMATQDIYGEAVKMKQKRPSTDKKNERDAALRMVLERAGGRKTTPLIEKAREKTELAPWVARTLQELPGAEEE